MARAEMDLSGFTATLSNLGRPINFSPVIKKIRQVLIGGTKTNFYQASTPDGQSWKPLKGPRYFKLRKGQKRRRRKSRLGIDKPLNDTGVMRSSVTVPHADGNIDIETQDSIEWGTDLIQAATHNYGDPRRNIPQREFLGISHDMEEDIEELVADFVADEVVRRLGAP